MMSPKSVALLVVASLLAGCGFFEKKAEDIPGATLPMRVGRVVMVDAGHRFVLLETGSAMRLAPGAGLLARRQRQTVATLEVTAESRPPYVAADILEGMPAVGDSVFLDESLPTVPEDPLPSGEEPPAEPWWEDFPEE